MCYVYSAVAAAALLITPSAATLGAQSASLEILPRDAEQRLALSAAPPHLRDSAGVVLLTATGFETARASSNGFTCIVNRDHPQSRKPVCYDREGAETVLPKVKFVGEMLLRGVALDSIDRAVRAKFASGEFIAPRRPGVAYMLSNEIRNFNFATGRADPFPPHIMFYAPNLTPKDIGVSAEAMSERPWLPFIGYQGPHGFMIVVVGRGA